MRTKRAGGRFPRTVIACVLLLLAGSVHARAQLQEATITGTVTGPDARPVSGATVTLLDSMGNRVASVRVADDGRFQVAHVGPGTYSLRADAPPFRALLQTLVVGGALPIDVELRMRAAIAEAITVRGDDRVEPGSTSTRVTLAGDAVRQTPVRLHGRGLQSAVATTPGWASEDNGVLHVRGVDDGFLYVIDGVPVYERLDAQFGVAPDPALVESVTVSTGYIPPEFGLKSGAVIDVRTAGPRADRWMGNIDFSAGSDATRHLSMSAGGPFRDPMTLTLAIAGETSDRFLDPVHPDNLHNAGDGLNGVVRFDWRASSGTTVAALAGFGGSDFDVPHGELQELSRQDQRQRLRLHWQTISAQRASSSTTVWQVAGYHRYGSATLAGSDHDVPLFSDADRSVRRVGVLASLTHHRGAHLFKVGGEAARHGLREHFLFAVTDPIEAATAGLSAQAIEHTREAPFEFDDNAAPTLMSFYLQDSVRPLARLTLDVGLRADWSRLLVPASQWSPRLGAAYSLPSTGTVFRASFGRFFQPPQAENLLLASSAAARSLSPFVEDDERGGADVQPERQTAVEAGITQTIGGVVRLDAAYWHRRVANVADPNVFFGTTIIFPNAVAKGRASGVDVRLEVPRRHGWSGFVSYTNSIVRQVGPITGGLFLEDDIAEIGEGTPFTPDHDQRNVGSAALTYVHERSGVWLSASARYESGTPVEAGDEDEGEFRQRPGAERVDFERGRVRPRNIFDLMGAKQFGRVGRAEVNLRVSLLNVTGARWAFNFGNPFSGTHFGPGRTLSAGVRVDFR